ncbi:4Fe-4S dicluster domain-containing protein [Nitratiruptor sp. YY09-18]|uniref:4Fe-4S dicluster domain-containing protein n=1 Tax=Nitratiruptor sp. YY09-18 TaxID=2724901 RepID=UPI001915AB08|nr:4Fe-4S dicluster domain-containing protein [Nitratiruptor sp. YY09-18]BCD68882.1 ferredoxin-type protein NapF [Nitratiruptor sp. YY09-18]
MQRREFFRSLIKPIQVQREESPLYPPYFKSVQDFGKCEECADKTCVKACEEEIIVIKNGAPSLDFRKSGCTFCDACAYACNEDVLNIDYKRLLPQVRIKEILCLAWNKTVCSMCKDVCLDNAIEFAGFFTPQVNEKCTGCGFCIGVCPTQAIVIGEEG